MAVVPSQISLAGDQELEIQWSDGQVRRYRFQEILDHCPCASCREKRGAQAEAAPTADPLSVIRKEETLPLKLVSMQPVGSYAYTIHFNHGCQQGIFTFESLRQLGREAGQD